MNAAATSLPCMTSDEFLVWAEGQGDSKFELHDEGGAIAVVREDAMTALDNLPAIRLKGRRGAVIDGLIMAGTSGLAPMMSAFSNAVDRLGYPDNQLRVVLANKLGLTRAAFERSNTVAGRLLNRLTTTDPRYIEFSGPHLRQVLCAGGLEVPSQIVTGETYLLRRDVVIRCKEALDAKLERADAIDGRSFK